MGQYHTPVLLKESIEALRVQPGGRYIDCTLGEGGHAAAILAHSSPGGQLLGFDADPQAIANARNQLREYAKSVVLVNENFNLLEEVATSYNFKPVHGILFDLGMSSLQVDQPERGFSFSKEAPLDMRFSPEQQTTAEDIVNELGENDLASLIHNYGEEPRSRKIARFIVRNRPLKTTTQLANVILKAVNGERGRIHPATRTFQALRIAVNREIESLKTALKQALNLLGKEGRIAIISFHSLEDRPVKEFLNQESRDCICPPEAPACVCNHTAKLKIITKNIIRPTEDEIKRNPRSRSAKLRVAERI